MTTPAEAVPAAEPATPAPVVVLVRPQLGVNIGAAARAMSNCALSDMRLVSPRDGWPNSAAFSSAGHADAILNNAAVFDELGAAIGDLHRVYATTQRRRDMIKPVMGAREAAALMRADMAAGLRVGMLFGPERTGLEQDEIARAHVIVNVPLNPGFASLNLAQAVLVLGYEWYMTDAPPRPPDDAARSELATAADLDGLLAHLAAELDASGYFAAIMEKRDGVLRNIGNIFRRVPLYEQDIRTLRGVVKALAIGRPLRPRRGGKRGRGPAENK
jgi:tRNA/rRNA methyltransferase